MFTAAHFFLTTVAFKCKIKCCAKVSSRPVYLLNLASKEQVVLSNNYLGFLNVFQSFSLDSLNPRTRPLSEEWWLFMFKSLNTDS